MWPFSRKLIPAPSASVEMQLKSLSLPQALPNWRLFAAYQKDWLPRVAINEGYNASAIVYACVEKRAKLIASVPWRVMIRRGDAVEQAPENHPLSLLINRPNPDLSWYELMYNVSQSLDLAGNAFLSEIKAGTRNLPAEVWHLPAEYIKIKPGSIALVDYFEYNNGGVKRRIEASDMIHLKLPNPSDPIFGNPVLRSAGRATDIDRESGIWQKVSLENRGASNLHIKVPEGTTQEQVDGIKRAYLENHAGPRNADKPFVSNAEIVQYGRNAQEMDFVASRRQVWVEIAAVFGMSLSNLGMTENVNLANAEAMEKSLWQDTIIPQLELMKRQLTHQLAQEYGPEVILDYDLSNVEALQEDYDKKLDNAVKLFGMGVPFNSINQLLELGLDDIEGGDTGYMPAGLLPAGWTPDMGVTSEPADLTDDQKRLLHKLTYG